MTIRFKILRSCVRVLSTSAPRQRTMKGWFFFGSALLLLLATPLIAQTVPHSSHVVLVIEENQQYSDVLSQMTWLSGEGNQYGYAANYQADTSGSLMDYLWLSSGSCEGPDCSPSAVPPGTGGDPVQHFGCTGDSCTSPITDDNIFRILSNNGVSWKEYMESYTGWDGPDTTLYVKRHNPAAWYSDVINNPSLQANIVDFGSNFLNDANANNLPNYSIVVPNLQDDGHDGTNPLAQADDWLRNNIAPILNTPPFQPGGDGLLIITFDECDAAAGGDCSSGLEHVYTAVIGPQVVPNTVSNILYKHENVLRTILEALGMTDFPLASGSVSSMSDFFFPVSGHLVSNIDDMTFTCESPCDGNAGPDTNTQMDGSSLKVDYLGSSPWSDAIFDAFPNVDVSSASQYSMDFYVTVSDPSAPWDLEFSMILDLNGLEYAFQNQCDFVDTTHWRVWNPTNGSWADTGVGCAPFTGSWNHFTLQFARNSSNQLVYTGVTINGTFYPWTSGLAFNAVPTSNGNSVFFRTRVVGNGTPTPFTMWIDNWNLN